MAKNKKKAEEQEKKINKKSKSNSKKSTTTKSVAKSNSGKTKTTEKASVTPKNNSKETKVDKTKKKKKKPNYWLLGLIVVVGAVVIGLLALRKEIFVATVNGKPITRWELIRELEKQGGEQVLESLVVQKLIDQEAAKNGVNVTEEDIDNEVEKIRATLPQGLSLEEALASQGQTVESLRKQLVVQVKVNKLVEDRVDVSDDEVNQYIEDNREFLVEEGVERSEEELQNQVREDLRQQKIQFEIGNFVQELRDNAIISYYKFIVVTPDQAQPADSSAPAQE